MKLHSKRWRSGILSEDNAASGKPKKAKARKRPNATSGAQFATLPFLESAFRFELAVVDGDYRHLFFAKSANDFPSYLNQSKREVDLICLFVFFAPRTDIILKTRSTLWLTVIFSANIF